MTRDSAIDKQSKLYAKNREKCGLIDPITLDEIECAFYSGGIWADEHPRWISVEDELPKKENSYLVTDGLGVLYGYFVEGGWCPSELDKKVTHWMCLPSPPRKEQDIL